MSISSRAASQLALLLLLSTASCTRPAAVAMGLKPSTRPQAASPEVGERLYATLCSSCHGADGRGATVLAAEIDPQPADFTRCNFKYRSTPSGTLPTADDLWRTLAVGLPGTSMPSFSELVSDAGLQALAREVQARCPRFAGEPAEHPLALPAEVEGGSAERGGHIYVREGCVACHGAAGRGDGPAAKTLVDAAGRAIRPRDYTSGRFRSGFTPRDIYRAFSTGLDGTPMPALPETVLVEERRDLTSFIGSRVAPRLRRALFQPPTWYDPARVGSQP